MNLKISLSIIFLYSITLKAAEVWVDPSDGEVNHLYVGAPGMLCSAAQFAKLTPKFTAITGEVVKCDRGITVVPKTVIVPNLAEISLRRSTQDELASCIGKTAIAFPLSVIGALALKENSNHVLSSAILIGSMSYVFWRPINFLLSHRAHQKFGITFESSNSDISIRQHVIDPFKINIAQDDDVRIYSNVLADSLQREQQGKISKAILYGVSRGSATVFETFAQLDAQGKSDNIGAVVCEGIFDSVPNIIENAPFIQRTKLQALMALGITRFKKDGMSPLSMLEKIVDKDKPIALITSKIDEEVPYQNTLNVYTKLRERGHTNVHILVLEKSAHHEYSLGLEKEKYQAFMHAFYRKYNLPYIKRFADSGEEYVNLSQPSTDV